MKKAATLLAATVALASCVDDVNLNTSASQSTLDEVYFTASIAEQDFYGTKKPQTRSAADESQRVQSGFYDLPVEGSNDLMLSVSTLDGMFGKYSPIPEDGKKKPATRGMAVTELSQYPMSVLEIATTSEGRNIAGDPYTAYTDDGTTWGGSHIKHSSSAVTRTVYAVYPSSDKYTIHPVTRTLQYTTPHNASDQCDLLYARADQSLGSEQKDSLHLTFKHLLTAVRFKIGSQQLPMSVIKNIVIEGISTSGFYSFDKDEWELYQGVNGVMSYQEFNTTGAENVVINGGENTFMLLPQKLTSSAKVKIYYEDYTADDDSSQGLKTLTASLATDNTAEWKAGQSVTYTLTDKEDKGDYVLEVELPGDLEFGPEGGSQPVNVLSYRHVGDDITPMLWKVQSYSSDGGKTWMSGGAANVPAGMSISPTEGISEGTDTTRMWVTLLPAQQECASHSKFLRYKTPLGHDGGAFDLSRHDYLNKPCAQTTANCYVVDAPGKYRIPTAYGNAIVNGQTNKAAYTDKAGYKHSTGNNFIAHNGNAIKAPMIKNNGINITRATLVWEDAKDLIDDKSIQLVDDGNAIEFEILPENIDQGNAVIAAMDGNTVVWSWHIWVTDEKASLAEPIEDDNADFMPLTLGWCSTSEAFGKIGREAAVRIVMPAYLKKRSSFRIRQNSSPTRDKEDNTKGNATYYNWGRKDPFPGAQSTSLPVGADENDQALSKPFYQAGSDAAALGLHAELHSVYGPNLTSLFAQGFLVGLNGFMTGYSIGQLREYIKNPTTKIPDPSGRTEKVAADAVPGYSQTWNGKFKDFYKIVDNENVHGTHYLFKVFPEETKPLVEHFPEHYWAVEDLLDFSSPEPFVYLSSGWQIRILDISGEHTEVLRFIIKKTAEEDVLSITAHFVKKVPVMITVGNYSHAIIGGIGLAVSSGFNIGSTFANSSLFTGGTDWCRELRCHGVPLNYGILHPNILLRDPISWVDNDGVGNLWNASQTEYNDKDKPVVKTIYDPCPAGYCVPSAKNMSSMTDDVTKLNYNCSTVKKSKSNKDINFPALGYRCYWDMAQPGASTTNNINDLIFDNGAQGMYWTASPAINKDEDAEKGAYAVNFRVAESYDYYGDEGLKYSPRVVKDLKLQPSYALPIRPIREK